MQPRLATSILVSALRRKVEAAGGFATVLAKGDSVAGAILLLCLPPHGLSSHGLSPARGGPAEKPEKGGISTGYPILLEREPTLDGPGQWRPISSQHVENEEKIEEYLARRRRADPDLWIIELDVAQAERFAAEIIAAG